MNSRSVCAIYTHTENRTRAGTYGTQRPVDEGAVSRNANDVLMLRANLKSLEERTVIVNKSVLETEKERDK